MKKKLLISACLCGKDTKYSGGNNLISNLEAIQKHFDLFLICPEVMGGLSIPRNPSEIVGDRVLSDKGVDVTKEFVLGAQTSLAIAQKEEIKIALLKESSPSCGKTLVHDGTFSGKKIPGSGIAAQLLRKNGITIYTEKEIDLLLQNET